MASVLDSIRAVYTDNYSMLKLGIFSFLIFTLYNIFVGSPSALASNYFFFLIVFFIYIGFISIIMHNRVQQNLDVLPMINPVSYLKISFNALIVLLPYLGVGLPLVSFVVGLFNFEGIPQMIAVGIVQLLVVAISLTALIYFCKDYNIKEGYMLSKVFSGFQDVLVYTILCILGLLILNLFTSLPVLYFAYSFFDVGPPFIFIVFYIITMNIAILADYSGQLWFDLDSKNNYYS